MVAAVQADTIMYALRVRLAPAGWQTSDRTADLRANGMCWRRPGTI